MDKRIQELVDYTKTKFGLSNYYLGRHQFFRNINDFNETVYTLSMEWFPNHTVEEEDGSNPEGTASIEIDLKTLYYKSAIFVMGKTYAVDGIEFDTRNRNSIIQWVEGETGLIYGRQFQLQKEEDGQLYFRSCIDGVAISPSGTINIKWNDEGKLTLFSTHGQFPSEELVKVEAYTLSLEQLEYMKREQLRLIESPSFEQEKIVPIYAMEEIFVTNDGAKTIPFEVLTNESSYLKIEQTMEWVKPLDKRFVRKEIEWVEDITAEQAFSNEPSPDTFPIKHVEQEKCLMAVKDFLRQEYPNDSGDWTLKHFYREKGYIQATLKENTQSDRVFQRKIKAWIDPKSFQVVNYMDSKLMLKMFEDFQSPEKVIFTKEEAFEKLKELFELTPYYVYDAKQKRYVLCGKLDCHYGVNASNGEVMRLDDF